MVVGLLSDALESVLREAINVQEAHSFSGLRILHITDTHWVRDPAEEVFGGNPDRSLAVVLDAALALPRRPDGILITGDLADDGSPDTYRRLRESLLKTELPVYVLPGNHDARESMVGDLSGGEIVFQTRIDFKEWSLFCLDSQVVGESYGWLSPEELEELERGLIEAAGRFAVVALHHGPLMVCPCRGCRLENAAEFLELLGRHPAVKVVLSGHTHLGAEAEIDGLNFFTTPSALFQAGHPPVDSPPPPGGFLETHTLDSSRIGFRSLDLFSNGELVSELHWVRTE